MIDGIIKMIKDTKWELLSQSEIDDFRHSIDKIKSAVVGSSAVLRRFLDRELSSHKKDKLAERLFDHYLYDSGSDYKLSFDDMQHMMGDTVALGHIDLRRVAYNSPNWNPAWSQACSEAKKAGTPQDYSGKLLWAWDNGAIGNYTVKFAGKVHANGGDCLWGGVVSYYDRFDLDPRWGWSPSNPQGRTAGGERRTRIGYMLDLGWDFNIITPLASALQGERDPELRFSGAAG